MHFHGHEIICIVSQFALFLWFTFFDLSEDNTLFRIRHNIGPKSKFPENEEKGLCILHNDNKIWFPCLTTVFKILRFPSLLRSFLDSSKAFSDTPQAFLDFSRAKKICEFFTILLKYGTTFNKCFHDSWFFVNSSRVSGFFKSFLVSSLAELLTVIHYLAPFNQTSINVQ